MTDNVDGQFVMWELLFGQFLSRCKPLNAYIKKKCDKEAEGRESLQDSCGRKDQKVHNMNCVG